jgi:hypothetical protein
MYAKSTEPGRECCHSASLPYQSNLMFLKLAEESIFPDDGHLDPAEYCGFPDIQ